MGALKLFVIHLRGCSRRSTQVYFRANMFSPVILYLPSACNEEQSLVRGQGSGLQAPGATVRH